MIVFGTFVLLVGLTAWHSWPDLRQKSPTDWILDGAGLWVQGLLIPLLQLTLLQTLYQQLFPAWHHSLSVYPVFAFILSFVVVDYLYYWNHRFSIAAGAGLPTRFTIRLPPWMYWAHRGIRCGVVF